MELISEKTKRLVGVFGVAVFLFGGVLLAVDEPGKLLAQDGPSSTPEVTDEPADMPDGTDPADVPDPNSEDAVERGKYLVMVAAACQDCHASYDDSSVFTDPLNVELKGGYVFEFLPWGTVYTPNLTQLGEWSDQAIEEAIRYGVAPDGTPLLPPMPYEAYAELSDDDMADIIAYLRSLEPVENEIPASEIFDDKTRADLRTVPEFDAEAEHPAPEINAPLDRGLYLGTTVAACIRCHGSINEDGSLNTTGPLAAEVPLYWNFGEFNAPELLQENLGEWSDEAIRTVIVDGIKPDGELIFFMPSHIFTNLAEADVDALIAWLRSQP